MSDVTLVQIRFRDDERDLLDSYRRQQTLRLVLRPRANSFALRSLRGPPSARRPTHEDLCHHCCES
jgi:hypothetical protein